MFLFYLRNLWGKWYVRLIVFLFFAILLSVFVYSQKIAIYNFIDHRLHGQLFDVPSTYQKNGFTENKKMSKRLTNSGFIKLARYAFSLYKEDRPKLLLKKDFSFDVSWSQIMQEKSFTAVDMLLHDMSLFCSSAFSKHSFREQWQTENKLQKLHTQKNKSGKKRPLSYAVTYENYEDVKRFLLRLDHDYFGLALQKKPDSVAAVTIRQDIFSALCLPSRSTGFWQNGLQYLEYKNAKSTEENNSQLKNDPDRLYTQTQNALAKNSRYRFFLKQFFLSGNRYATDMQWKRQESWDAYAFTHDKYYFRQYLQSTIQQLKTFSKEENCKTFSSLYKVGYRGIEKEFLYTYALAESAFRCGKINKAKSITNHIIKQKFYKEDFQYRMAKRLAFLIQLEGY